MSEDRPNKPGFLDRLLGYDPEVTRKKTEQAKQVIEEINKLSVELQKRADANLEHVKVAGEAQLATSQAELDGAREDLAHQPKLMGNVIDLKLVRELALSKGLSTQEAYAQAGINQFDDGYGNIIYLSPSVRMDQVHTVSARITEQQKSFGVLGADEQIRARTEFGSAMNTTPSPYLDFLQSEALEKRFQELKQPRSGPK